MASFCNSGESQGNRIGYQDPLGPTSIGPNGRPTYSASGAPQMRGGIFDYAQGVMPQAYAASGAAASGLQSAANNPFWASAQREAGRNLSGDYLSGSPELNRAMAAQTSGELSAAADQNARNRDTFAKSGMDFSTGQNQASQANMAAAGADANRANAATYLQNYQAERANQLGAPTMMNQAQTTPLNYLQQVAPALMAPAAGEGNLLSALSSGGQTTNLGSSGVTNPSTASSLMNAWGALTSNL